MAFDVVTDTLYLRSNEVNPIHDPDSNAWVTTTAITISSMRSRPQYVDFRDITMAPGTSLILGYETGLRFFDLNFCSSQVVYGTFPCNDQNVADGATVFDGIYARYIGSATDIWCDPSGLYKLYSTNGASGIYVSGPRLIVRDSVLVMARGGTLLNGWAHQSPLAQIYDCVFYGMQGAILDSGAGGRTFNNVMLMGPMWMEGQTPIVFPGIGLGPSAWVLTLGSTGQTFDHNYVEVNTGEAIVAGYRSTEIAIDIDDNVFVQSDPDSSPFIYGGPGMTLQGVNNNLWIGNGNHGAYLNGGAFNTSDPATFMAYLQRRGGPEMCTNTRPPSWTGWRPRPIWTPIPPATTFSVHFERTPPSTAKAPC